MLNQLLRVFLESEENKNMNTKTAYDYLMEASKINPGPWVDHSIYVAKAARRIAENLDTIDPNLAESYGYIHDIGRRFGITKMKHTIDGYYFLKKEGYLNAARICLTHSFPSKNIEDSVGDWDCSKEDYLFIKKFIESIEYTIYDQLLQLCDTLALPSGFTIVERRLIDVGIRYGVDNKTVKRWKAFFALQNSIENRLGYSIYALFPEIEENLLKKPLCYSLKI